MADTEKEVLEKYGKVYNVDQVIFKEGDIGEEMYIIQEGEVKITKTVKGTERVLSYLKTGEFFGEMAVIDKEPRSANVVASQDNTKVIIIHKDVFESQIQKNPKIAMRILKKMSMRLREANKQIETLMIKDNTTRVVTTLINLIAKNAEFVDGLHVLDFDFAIESIEDTTGVSKDRAIEVIEKLQKARLAKIEDSKLFINNKDDLEKFLSYLEMKERFGNM
ncbi:MAG: Crp/Fnr family transcriptional regulator [Candidatus Firestonebacteria bacterium]|nr:Crp/Fnr family transcriptional regulator [Candidatus Firestonebacteria bacterium]